MNLKINYAFEKKICIEKNIVSLQASCSLCFASLLEFMYDLCTSPLNFLSDF